MRAKPTVIVLTAGEVKDAETRRRFRMHLRRADAQQRLERKLVEQNRDSPPRARSSSTSNAQAKDEPEPAARQDLRRVLQSSPPQSPVVSGEHIVSASSFPSPESPDGRRRSDQEPRSAQDDSQSTPSPSDTHPSRLPHVRSNTAPKRPAEMIGRQATAAAPYSHRHDTSGTRLGRSATAHPAEAAPKSATSRASPTLPPPFSRASRGLTPEYDAPTVRSVPTVSYQ